MRLQIGRTGDGVVNHCFVDMVVPCGAEGVHEVMAPQLVEGNDVEANSNDSFY
jgi:hypothetical protein